MRYTQGTLGRVFVACLEDGESIYDAAESIAAAEGISCGACWAVGGMRKGKVVVGPKQTTGVIEPQHFEFDDAREIVGFGKLFKSDGKPKLHFHAAIGRGDEAIVGCPRDGMNVYLTLEVVIIELSGVDAARELDPDFGVHLLKLHSAKIV